MTQYNNPTPLGVAIVPVMTKGDIWRVLAIERATEPKVGEFALPGGYVEELESLEEAAARELREETGLDLPPQSFQLLCSRTNATNRCLAFSVYRGAVRVTEADITRLVPTKEALSFKLIGPKDKLAFPLHMEAMQLFWQTCLQGTLADASYR